MIGGIQVLPCLSAKIFNITFEWKMMGNSNVTCVFLVVRPILWGQGHLPRTSQKLKLYFFFKKKMSISGASVFHENDLFLVCNGSYFEKVDLFSENELDLCSLDIYIYT